MVLYSKVYKACNSVTKELVALKRIRMESERDGVSCLTLYRVPNLTNCQFPITAVREMKLLQALKQVNVVSLLEMMVEKSKLPLLAPSTVACADITR